MFFSDYGKFMHSIIELYLRGELGKGDLVIYYLTNFRKEVIAEAPNPHIFQKYFQDGLRYLTEFEFPYMNVFAVEQKLDFKIEDKNFVGVIDCVVNDDAVVILDNKSRTLSPRSRRKKPTKSDKELDSYLRQLYLYSVPIKDLFYKYPDRLEFNCFRSGKLISEPFNKDALNKTKEWALSTIEKITNNDVWKPDMEYWKCRYLCDVNQHCEYYQMNRR